jgi:predicted RNA binding protein YcfA (HicA-like mRNA interferase family)
VVFKPMKRRTLVAKLVEHGCAPLRNRGGHEVFGCGCHGNHIAPVPNHAMVTGGTVASIEKQWPACRKDG